MIEGKLVRLSMLNYFYQLIQDIFVKKETGKGLSTNDYTTDEKTAVAKIAGIETALDDKIDGEIIENGGGYPEAVRFNKVTDETGYIEIGEDNEGKPFIKSVSSGPGTIYNHTLATDDNVIKSITYGSTVATPTVANSGNVKLNDWVEVSYSGTYDAVGASTSITTSDNNYGITVSKTPSGVTLNASDDQGSKGFSAIELASKNYVDGYITAVNKWNVKFSVPIGSTSAWIDYSYDVSGTNYRQYINYNDNTKTLNYAVVDTDADTTVESAAFPSTVKVQEMIAAELGDITGVDFVVVAANENLPETGVKGKFYLKATGTTGNNKYDEYVWVNHGTVEEPDYGYEKLGTMEVDLTGYIKESDLQFATKADIDAIFSTNSGE